MKFKNIIENIDDSKVKDRRLVDYVPEDFRMLVCGSSGSGKTSLVINMITEPLLYYDKIYIFTPNHFQPSVVKLMKWFESINEQIDYPVIEIYSPEQIPEVVEYREGGGRKIVIFDDVINCEHKIQKRIIDHFTQGRHRNISPIYLLQYFYNTPKVIRNNCNLFCLFKPNLQSDIDEICRTAAIDDKKILNQLNPYDFIYVNRFLNSIKKNFDEGIN